MVEYQEGQTDSFQIDQGKSARRLVFRLSSLGDVILATVVLQANGCSTPVDWVVAREFAEVLEGHPGVRKVWVFDRSSGIKGWLELCEKLIAEEYSEVWDLHCTLRTRLALGLFWLKKVTAGSPIPRWKVFSKERWRLVGLFLFKKYWPRIFFPKSFVSRFAKFAGGTGLERPDLRYLVKDSRELLPTSLMVGSYFCVMPGSKWRGKRWSASQYFEVIQKVPGAAVIMGSTGDEEAFNLVTLLKNAGYPHVSGVGCWSLSESATVLAGSRGYLGNDTGLAHLAEAVGVPAAVIFGPTTPEMGFGGWRSDSLALGTALWCRPCGKDGRRCYRVKNKYLCMSSLSSSEVAEKFRQIRESKRVGSGL